MKALVISHRHALLPIAWRLKQEEWDVQVIIDRDSWERAWQGRFEPTLKRGTKRNKETMVTVRQVAADEDAVVLCDSPAWLEVFAGYPRLFGVLDRPEGAPPLPPVLVGAWFDGESFSARHLLVEDWGLWPGGFGPRQLGGLTLVRLNTSPEPFETGLARVRDELKARDYLGLVKVGVLPRKDRDGNDAEPVVVGYQAGWNFLQAHAFLAEAGDGGTPSLTQVLLGQEPSLLHGYTVTLPVTVPPYPNRAKTGLPSSRLPIPPKAIQCGQFYWHDMMVEDGMVKTAGLDGLVGVARGSANQFRLARDRALRSARLLVLPELQLRLDVGATVEGWLSWMEDEGAEL